jgi:hypothetical protein
VANEPYGIPLDEEDDELDGEEEEDDEEEDEGPSDNGPDFDRPKRKKKDTDENESGETTTTEAGKTGELAETEEAAGTTAELGESAAAKKAAEKLIERGVIAEGSGGLIAALGGWEVIIPTIVIIISVIVFALAIALFIKGWQGAWGSKPGDLQSAPFTNQQDALNLKDVDCLNKAIALDKDGNGKLDAACVQPITSRATIIINSATSIKGKIADTEKDAAAAKKILDDLITAANKAKGVTAGMDLKTVRQIRNDITTQYNLAITNALISKYRGVSANAQKIIDYVQTQPEGTCKQTDPNRSHTNNCYYTNEDILFANFHGTLTRESLGGGTNTEAPTDNELQQTRDVITRGDLPVWLIWGDNGGNHWIMILNIDNDKNITFFEPVSGSIKSKPSTWTGDNAHSALGGTVTWTYFFGSPSFHMRGNETERGLIYPTSKMTPIKP